MPSICFPAGLDCAEALLEQACAFSCRFFLSPSLRLLCSQSHGLSPVSVHSVFLFCHPVCYYHFGFSCFLCSGVSVSLSSSAISLFFLAFAAFNSLVFSASLFSPAFTAFSFFFVLAFSISSLAFYPHNLLTISTP